MRPRQPSERMEQTPTFSAEARGLLPVVQINMPWRMLGHYSDMVREHRLNLEIGISGIDLERTGPARFREAAAELHGVGSRLSLHAPFRDLCAGSGDPMIRWVTLLRFHQFLDVAVSFAPLVSGVCHLGFDPVMYGEDPDGWLERSLEVWGPVAGRAEAEGVSLCLENVRERGPEMHRAVLERIDSPALGFCLDVGHQHAFSNTPLSDWIGALRPYLREVHLHDNDGSDDTHRPIGRGTIDFRRLFGSFEEKELQPLMTLEPHTEADLYESVEGLAGVLRTRTTGRKWED